MFFRDFRRRNLPREIFSNGGAPLRALRMYEIAIRDSKPDGSSDLNPQSHFGIGNPRIESEPVLVGRIAWEICWKLRQPCFPLVTQRKLLGPATVGRCDHGRESVLVGDRKSAFSQVPDVRLKTSKREHYAGCSW